MQTPEFVRRLVFAGLIISVGQSVLADAEKTITGEHREELVITCSTATTINLRGVTFNDCSLKLVSANEASPVTYTLNLVDKTTNTFNMTGKNKECIKATKKTNIVITGGGSLELTSEKRITDKDSETGAVSRSGVLVCNNLTVNGGDVTATFDADKSDTSCIFLKGSYVQNGGKVKVDMKKKNCTNELHGVTFDSDSGSFKLVDGTFKADLGGTKSRAIHLKKKGSAWFCGGEVEVSFEGPDGRFVNGGTLEFSGGKYLFTTNITSKMQIGYYPTGVQAVKADLSTTITGGDFEADLPLEGSEVFTADSTSGTFVKITGGTFDLVSGNDCIHANGDISISGGRIRVVSTGDDGIDANGGMTISGGDIRAYATAGNTHGLDINLGKTLTISGGIVIATDGPDTHRIGSGYSDVGSNRFEQACYYDTISPASGYSQKYLLLQGQTNGVNFTVKPCLPVLTGGNFNLLVSVPGRLAASKPAAKTLSEAYADRSTRCPLVFEKKARVDGRTVTTKEGAVLTLPEYYDLTPEIGKTKNVSLSLNASAVPTIASIAVGSSVQVAGRTLSGLKYQLQRSTAPGSTTWTAVGSAKSGNGSVQTFADSKVGSSAFYRMSVTD